MKRELTSIYLIGFCFLTAYQAILPMASLYAKELSASITDVAVGVSAFYIAAIIARVPLARLSERIGRTRMLVTSIVICLFSTLSYLFTSNPYQFVLVRVVHGLSCAAVTPIALSLVSSVTTGYERVNAIGLYTAISALGIFLGPAIGSAVVANFGIRGCFSLSALIVLMGLLSTYYLKGLRVKEEIGGVSGAKTGGVFRSDMLVGLCGSYFAHSYLYGAIVTFLPLYANMRLGITPSLVSLLFSVYALSTLGLRASVARLVKYVKQRNLIILGLANSSILSITILYAGEFNLLVALMSIMGLSSGIIYPVGALAISRTYSESSLFVANALFLTMFDLGMMVSPLTNAIVAERFGLEAVFIASIIPALTSMVIAYWKIDQEE